MNADTSLRIFENPYPITRLTQHTGRLFQFSENKVQLENDRGMK